MSTGPLPGPDRGRGSSSASPSASPPAFPCASPSAGSVALFWLVAIALFVGLRAVALDADAPRVLAHGGVGTEMLVEPPAKAHEARNWASFGAWHLNPADDYQFWRPQSPLWVYPLAGAFRVFGTSYETLRMTATAFGLIGLVALGLWGHRRWGPSGAVLAVVLVAFDNVGIFWGRSGILEPIVAAWLALAFFLLDRAFDHVGWAVPAVVVLALALGTKLAAAPAVPVFAVYGLVLLVRAPGARDRWRARVVLAAVATLVGALLLAWVLSPGYQRTLAWNFEHMVAGRDGGTRIDLDVLDDLNVGAGIGDLPRRLKVFFLVFSATLLLGIAEAGLVVRELVQRRAGLRQALPVAWLLSFAIVVLASTFFGFRFVLLLGPPLVLLAVGFLHRVAEWVKTSGRRALARRVLPGAAVAYAAAHLGAWAYAVSRLEHQVRDAAAVVQRRIDGHPAPVCIGLWSAPVVLETTCKHFYVKTGFNATRDALEALRPSHLLLMPKLDDTRSQLRRAWPELIERSVAREVVPLRDKEITILEVPPEVYEPAAKGAARRKKKKMKTAVPASD